MAKKKVNPRRVPLPKKAIDKDAIIEEAMKDDILWHVRHRNPPEHEPRSRSV